eukprot:jgi/Picsp_1/1374/NSC_04853-R1_protein
MEDSDYVDVESVVYVPPGGKLPERQLSQEEIDSDLKEIKKMWEMAAIVDFLVKFREELKLSVEIGPSELEHVLVCSNGDGGLLASLHIEIMKGISSKNQVSESNWQCQLANKIRYHWRSLSDKTPCPFKPEKYLEAPTYAGLPAKKRVRALYFLCCIRCDREDIVSRINEASAEKPQEEIDEAMAVIEAANQKALRSTRSAKSTKVPYMKALETAETFRRIPDTADESGNLYFIFDIGEDRGFRLYKYIPCAANQDGVKGALPPSDLEDENPMTNKVSKKNRERLLSRDPLPKSQIFHLNDPNDFGNWELLASEKTEFEDLQNTFLSSEAATNQSFGELISNTIEKIEEIEKTHEARERAASRLRSTLGAFASYAYDGEVNPSKRQRKSINYRFDQYDKIMDSAIRGSNINGRVSSRNAEREEKANYAPEDRGTRRLRRQNLYQNGSF